MTSLEATKATGVEDPVSAWRRITGSTASILAVDRLKKNSRTQVYRLWLGGREPSVIAKRCVERVAQLEHAVYTKLLDRRALRAPVLYAFGADAFTDGEHAYRWLFIEDLGARRHDPSSDSERTSLAHWLGTLGALTVDARASGAIDAPDRGLPYYRGFLHSVVAGLPTLAQIRALTIETRELIDSTLITLEHLDNDWRTLEELARSAPTVIAHGDCLPKNIHVTADPENAVVPIDWGSLGFGLPAADLGVSSITFEGAGEFEPCIDVYVKAMRPTWPDVTNRAILVLASAGRTLWATKLLAQSLPGMHHYRSEKVELMLKLYLSLLNRSSLYLTRHIHGAR